MTEKPCVDDPSIADAEILWRFIHPNQLTLDKQTNRWRPKSGAFCDAAVSDDVSSRTTLAAVQAKKPGHSIARLHASDIRQKKFRIVDDRLVDNLAHAFVCPKMSEAIARSFATREDIWEYLAPPNNDQI